jgi:hypothetical protein
VLKFDTRPDGPAGKILTFLRTYQNQLADVVALVDCRGRGEFSITAHAPLPETDRGVLACKSFCDALEAGAVSLRSCVKNLGVAEIAKLRSVVRLAKPPIGGPVAPAPATPGTVATAAEPSAPTAEHQGG